MGQGKEVSDGEYERGKERGEEVKGGMNGDWVREEENGKEIADGQYVRAVEEGMENGEKNEGER